MKKTTIYIPADLKRDLEAASVREGRSSADFIREAIATAIDAGRSPDPRIPLTARGLGDPTIAERTEVLLEDFGR
ncbi:MAG TPA: CopG family transcriptional regulator [Thermoanaerobaculia bacterium]|nr:CopG family transcriptional regulator [Thermoanaerobaculia bacterium]